MLDKPHVFKDVEKVSEFSLNVMMETLNQETDVQVIVLLKTDGLVQEVHQIHLIDVLI
jgi:hypothetical protein